MRQGPRAAWTREHDNSSHEWKATTASTESENQSRAAARCEKRRPSRDDEANVSHTHHSPLTTLWALTLLQSQSRVLHSHRVVHSSF